MNYAYIRVSTQDQNEERQLIAMHDHGIGDAHFFIDKQSGKDFDRPHYQRMLKRLKPGDVLFVKSILMLVIRFTIDGTVARKMGAESEFGAKLDTAADTFFVPFGCLRMI